MGKGRSNGASGAGRRSRSQSDRSSSSQPLTDKARGNRRRANEAAGQMAEINNERRQRAARTFQAARPATNTATLAGGSSAQRASQAAARARVAASKPQGRIARAVAAVRSVVTRRRGG